MAAGFGAEPFSDAAAMIDRCKPDGLAIVVNPFATAVMVELAAERGLPFLTEKPPAPDAATHARLIDRVGSLRHLVAYNRRFAPYMTQARQWLAGQAIQSVTAMFVRHRRHDADFTTTAVHAIDAVRSLAGDDYAELRVEIAPAGPVRNFFLTGWTRGGARIDILITPDTASAEEHYIVRSADRTVRVAFPHPGTIDLPGYVELHENKKLTARLGPGNFHIDPNDQPALIGIVAEHEAFCKMLSNGEAADSTLAATLQTQRVRDELGRLAGQGGRTSCVINLE